MEYKGKNGITLIALVITIIVLLILAGISIATLTGENGILNKANTAKTENKKASGEEQVKLAVMGSYDERGKLDPNKVKNELKKIPDVGEIRDTDGGFPIEVDIDGYTYVIEENGEVTRKPVKPVVKYTLDKTEQVPEGTAVTVNITASIAEGTIVKITKPKGEIEYNSPTTSFVVTTSNIYEVVVEGSNGATTTCKVEVLNIGTAEIFSDIYEESQTYIDEKGNTAKIPKGFAVGKSNTINKVEKGLVITDKINENHRSTGNEFVWIPCGTIRASDSTDKTINLNRYSFDANGVPTAVGEAGVATTNNRNWIKAYEYVKSDYDVRTAKNLAGFKSSVESNGGYYIGRFEAGDPTATKYKTSSGPFTATPVVKKSQFPYSYIYQSEASNLSKKMYPDTDTSLDITSDLINSYSWDTALEFIYQCSGDKSYASKTYSAFGGGIHKTGERGSTNYPVDIKCNIYDMAGNYIEYSTETSTDANWCRTLRGGGGGNSTYTAGSRHTNSLPYSNRSSEYAFRPIIYFKN